MVDISTQGVSVTLKGGSAVASLSNILSDFAADGAPIQIPNTEVAGHARNLNGQLITWTRSGELTVSMSFIPGSDADQKLRTFIKKCLNGGNHIVNAANVKVDSLSISYAKTGGDLTSQSITFQNGRLINGPVGIGSHPEGRATTATYTFVFESVGQDGV